MSKTPLEKLKFILQYRPNTNILFIFDKPSRKKNGMEAYSQKYNCALKISKFEHIFLKILFFTVSQNVFSYVHNYQGH